MEFQLSLNDAIAVDATLKKVANMQGAMSAFGQSFNTSGKATVLESSHLDHQRSRYILKEKLSRGNTAVFTDLRTLIASISEDGPVLGIFVTDSTVPGLGPLMEHVSAHRDLQKVGLLGNAIIIHHKAKAEALQSKLPLIKKEAETILSAKNPKAVSSEEIVARIRLLGLLGHEEEDVLAFVYDVYRRVDQHKDLNKFLTVISRPDLFHAAFGKSGPKPPHEKIQFAPLHIKFVPPCGHGTKKHTSNNDIPPKIKESRNIAPNTEEMSAKGFQEEQKKTVIAQAKAVIPRDAATLPPVITSSNQTTQHKNLGPRPALVPAVPLPPKSQNKVASNKKKKGRCMEQQVPATMAQTQDFGLAFL